MNMSSAIKIAILFFCLVLAGPEFGLGLELVLLMDSFGVELVFISLSASLWGYCYIIKSQLEKIDPYFFLSPFRDVVQCPALLAHAIPGFMGSFMFLLALTAVAA